MSAGMNRGYSDLGTKNGAQVHEVEVFCKTRGQENKKNLTQNRLWRKIGAVALTIVVQPFQFLFGTDNFCYVDVNANVSVDLERVLCVEPNEVGFVGMVPGDSPNDLVDSQIQLPTVPTGLSLLQRCLAAVCCRKDVDDDSPTYVKYWNSGLIPDADESSQRSSVFIVSPTAEEDVNRKGVESVVII
eukprot:Trichotokara_eunicae@DN2031_c0_g1_i1.p1